LPGTVGPCASCFDEGAGPSPELRGSHGFRGRRFHGFRGQRNRAEAYC
jgi:hypothetical protein